VEQEQNGVTAPRAAPKMLFKNFLGVVNIFCILSFDIYTCKRATIKLIPINSSSNSPNRNKKVFPALIKLSTVNMFLPTFY
jgi:hypothetical protein